MSSEEVTYDVYYHSGITKQGFSGRMTPVCWMLSELGIKFNRFAPDAAEGKFPGTFAVPKVKSSDGVICMSQVPAIMQAVGTKHKCAPQDNLVNQMRAVQYAMDAADFLSECFKNKGNPDWFTGDRFKKWLNNLTEQLKVDGKGFLIGDKVTYCDFSMLLPLMIAQAFKVDYKEFKEVDEYVKKMMATKGYTEWAKEEVPIVA